MKNVVVFIESDPSAGGVYYYNRSILNAVSFLPKDKYNVIVIYTDKLWEAHINCMKSKVYIPFGKYYKRLVQLLLMIGVPPSVICCLLGRVNYIARTITNLKPDICVFPSQETFWGYVTRVPSIVAIHDLMHRYERRFKEVSGFGKYYHKERHFNNVCKSSIGILVDSEIGRKHVCESYQYPLENVYVLPYIPQPSIVNDCQKYISYKYSLPEKYIFYPAQFWPHKNHMRLIRAISRLKQYIPDIKIVLIGSKGEEYKSLVKLVRELKIDDAVLFMGYVPEGDMIEFYKRATAMVMPTFFGPTNIPPLEAFVVGCPIAVSNVFGMPELVGDAGLLFNPSDEADIANAIKQLWLSEELRNELIINGYKKAINWGHTEFNNRFEYIINSIAS